MSRMDMTTAVAHPNIAFIKYWGNLDTSLRLPANGSISMTLDGLETRTSVQFDPQFEEDSLELNGEIVRDDRLRRVVNHLDYLRRVAERKDKARIVSNSNFPVGSGIASSASGFASLTLAAAGALDLELSQTQLSVIARRGSGSASRSIFGGFVEWRYGMTDEESYSEQLAPPDHWELVDLIAIVSTHHKPIGSSEGHQLADSSPFQAVRVADSHRRLSQCKNAILHRDFEHLAKIIELDSTLMHSVMMSSSPPLFYWEPETLGILTAVFEWRANGLAVCATVDAGPNVHLICLPESAQLVEERLTNHPGVIKVIKSTPGADAAILNLS
jgi:diphosphomevalonate decarboxylase